MQRLKILITGANGFSAGNMLKILPPQKGLVLTDIKGTKNVTACDLADFDQTLALIKKTKPDRIYHFSGSFTNNYLHDYKCNVLTTKNILDSILQLKLTTRVLLIGSSAEYGLVKPKDNPIAETQPLKPVSIYGLTKSYQSLLMSTYVQLYNLDVVMARTFNLLGKNMSPALFIGNVYKQIEQYRSGQIENITLGNLRNKRDYITIEQAVGYYQLIMEKGRSGEVYNVGSGQSIKMEALLKAILKQEKISFAVVKTQNNLNHNKLDIKDIRADISKLKGLL